MKRFEGLYAATYTPMASGGAIELSPIEELAARLHRDGVAGVFVCGTTGEFSSLETGERKRVARRWREVSGDGLDVIVHVGSTRLCEARELAAHAREIGAGAMAAVAPFYLRPSSAEALSSWCEAIASAAPDLPFFYYHIPSLSGVRVPVAEFLERARGRIPTLAGVKYSSPDLRELGQCVARFGEELDFLFGVDEMLLWGLSAGARGAVGTTYGFAAPLALEIIEAFGAHDLPRARRLQALESDMVEVFLRRGGHRAMKAAMRMVGIDCGPVRPPLSPLGEAEYAELEAELDAIGFRELCSGSGGGEGKRAP